MHKLTARETFLIMLTVLGLTTLIGFAWIPGVLVFVAGSLGLVVSDFES